jgi:phosphoribosylformylglycinamidine synthase
VTRVGVVTFPGSLDDRDALNAVGFLGAEPVSIWHGDEDVHAVDAVIFPGGFSYGDYLRCGAIARFAGVMDSVRAFAEAGGPVLGICNGFQVLCEAGLLPGALIRNNSMRFICRWVDLRVESTSSALTQGLSEGDVLRAPIKHGEGHWIASEEEIGRVESNGLVILRYCSPSGEVADRWNPNGSTRNIAGLRSPRGNVVGLMPHPEHAVDPDLGPTGGAPLLRSLLEEASVRR